MSAKDDILKELEDGEEIEAVVFGNWGWKGQDEPEPPIVPDDKKGTILSWKEAQPYLIGWDANGGYGPVECYAIYVWTNKRVLWITQYGGATDLDSAPRNPTNIVPVMTGC